MTMFYMCMTLFIAMFSGITFIIVKSMPKKIKPTRTVI